MLVCGGDCFCLRWPKVAHTNDGDRPTREIWDRALVGASVSLPPRLPLDFLAITQGAFSPGSYFCALHLQDLKGTTRELRSRPPFGGWAAAPSLREGKGASAESRAFPVEGAEWGREHWPTLVALSGGGFSGKPGLLTSRSTRTFAVCEVDSGLRWKHHFTLQGVR